MIKSMDEVVAFNKGNFDAVVKTGNLAVKGFEALSKAYMAAAKVQFDAIANCRATCSRRTWIPQLPRAKRLPNFT